MNLFHSNRRKIENIHIWRIWGDTIDDIAILIAWLDIIIIFIFTDGIFISNIWSRFYEMLIKNITYFCRFIYNPVFMK